MLGHRAMPEAAEAEAALAVVSTSKRIATGLERLSVAPVAVAAAGAVAALEEALEPPEGRALVSLRTGRRHPSRCQPLGPTSFTVALVAPGVTEDLEASGAQAGLAEQEERPARARVISPSISVARVVDTGVPEVPVVPVAVVPVDAVAPASVFSHGRKDP